MPTMTMSLEAKLRAVLAVDDTGDGPTSVCSKRPGWHNLTLSNFEMDLRDWGMYFGIAFGIARGEEPFEAAESVAIRAAEAAWPIFCELNGGFSRGRPDRDARIAEVTRAYESAHRGAREPEPRITRELGLAIERLANEEGV